MLGEIDPEYRILVAPEDATPTDQYVAVAVRPVQAGNCIVAAGETELLVTVQPPEVLKTATLA